MLNGQQKLQMQKKTKAYCEQLLATHALPKPVQMFIQETIRNQEKKTERYQGKIDNKGQKIRIYKSERNKCHKRIAKQQAKIDSIAGIDRFITNMASAQGRREAFVQALAEMRKASLERKDKKALTVENKIAQKELALSKAGTAVEKVRIRQQIDKLNVQKDKLAQKINQLVGMAEKLDDFVAMSERNKETVIADTAERLRTFFDQGGYTNMDDIVIDEAEKAIDNRQPDRELTVTESPAEQKQEQQTERHAAQDNSQTIGANKPSEFVRFSNLSGEHLQALNDAKIPMWVRRESENTFSAFVQRPNAERVKSVLANTSQVRHTPRPKM